MEQGFDALSFLLTPESEQPTPPTREAIEREQPKPAPVTPPQLLLSEREQLQRALKEIDGELLSLRIWYPLTGADGVLDRLSQAERARDRCANLKRQRDRRTGADRKLFEYHHEFEMKKFSAVARELPELQALVIQYGDLTHQQETLVTALNSLDHQEAEIEARRARYRAANNQDQN